MRGVAGQEYPLGTVRIRNHLPANPGYDRKDFEVKILSHGADDRGSHVGLREYAPRRIADDREPEAVVAINGDQRAPRPFRPDKDEPIALFLVVEPPKIRTTEYDVGRVGQRGIAGHGDTQPLPDRTGSAVGADQKVCLNRLLVA